MSVEKEFEDKFELKIEELREKRETILKKASEDVKIDQRNLQDESRETTNKVQFFLELLSSYRRTWKVQERQLEKVRGELYAYYKCIDRYEEGIYGPNFKLKLTSADVNVMIGKDPKYQRHLAIYHEYEETVKILLEIVKNFSNRGFAIKNIIDLLQLNL